jgi:hypothetical protein
MLNRQRSWLLSIVISMIAFCLFGSLGSTSLAQLPTAQLDGLFPPGSAANSTLEVVVSGLNLDETDKLVFSHASIKSSQKLAEATPFDEGQVPIDNTFIVTVGNDVPPGRYEVRTQGKYGLSNTRTFMVSSMPETVEKEPNGNSEMPAWKEVEGEKGTKKKENLAVEINLPMIINGQSTGGPDVDWYRFQGTAGNRLLIDAFAKQIDSRMEVVMTLYRADGVVIGEGRTGSCGDPFIHVLLPNAGDYFLKVHDVLYRSGPGYHYRVRVGAFPHIDFIFPPMGPAGSNEEYSVFGSNLPGGVKSNWSVDGEVLDMVKVRIPIPADIDDKLDFRSMLGPHQGGIDGLEYRMGEGNNKSNPFLMTAASAPIVFEQTNNDRPESAQKLTIPSEVAGQFFPQHDKDWYSFEAKKGDVLVLDVVSQRLGIATDPSLLIQHVVTNEKGETQITNVQFVDDVPEQNFNNQSGRHEFDPRSSDPSYLFTAPADGTYRVLLKDTQSSVKSDPRFLYRFAIRKPSPDFRVVAVPGQSSGGLLLRRGSRSVVRVFAYRRDSFAGEIRVSCTGLPAGVTSEEIFIGPGNTMGTLILTTSKDAAPSVSSLKISAKSNVDGKEVVRNARYGAALEPFQFAQPNQGLPSVLSRIVDTLTFFVTDYDPTPAMLTIGEGKILETSRAGILKVPFQVTKAQGANVNLLGFPIDFPPQTNAPQVNIGGNEKGEFTLTFQANTPPGTYSFYLAGFNQGYQYTRNPELTEKAVKRQERIAKLFTDSQQNTQKMQQLATEKQTQLQTATNARNQAVVVAQQASTELKSVENALKSAEDTLKNEQAALAAKPEDAGLKTKVVVSQTVMEATTKKLAESKVVATDTIKKQEVAEANLKAAEKDKADADKVLKDTRDFEQKAQQEKQRTDQFANQKKNESNPRAINFDVPSNSLTIKVTEFPLQVDALPAEMSIKQGEKLEGNLKLTRLYDFKSNVNFQVQLPGGVGGMSFQSINVAEGQSEGKFTLDAQPTATVGTHDCVVRLQMVFNGQNLLMERPLKLIVVEVKKP